MYVILKIISGRKIVMIVKIVWQKKGFLVAGTENKLPASYHSHIQLPREKKPYSEWIHLNISQPFYKGKQLLQTGIRPSSRFNIFPKVIFCLSLYTKEVTLQTFATS